VGYRFGFRRGFGQRVIPLGAAALLWPALNIPSARAADAGVTVACPELPEARAAELEARARATLLTSELAATVAISCSGDAVMIRVEVGDESVTLKVRVEPATLREEVLRALDRALADLRARARLEPQNDGVPGGSSGAPQPVETQPAPAKPPNASTTAPAVAPVEPSQEEDEEVPSKRERPVPRGLEVAAHLMAESWSKVGAIGGGLGAGASFDSGFRCGVRVGALHPLGIHDFAVLEGHAMAELAFTEHAVAGLRFGMGAGPSLLFVSPSSGLSAAGATLKSAVRLETQLSRPFRLGRVELSPWVGLRFFSAERGVRVAQHTRLVLGGVLPQGGLALSFAQ